MRLRGAAHVTFQKSAVYAVKSLGLVVSERGQCAGGHSRKPEAVDFARRVAIIPLADSADTIAVLNPVEVSKSALSTSGSRVPRGWLLVEHVDEGR